MIAAGTRLGHYRVDSLIGEGGMGRVYRGIDTRLDRTVAIKVLAPHLAGQSQVRERFEREARVVSALAHPHICTLYDVGTEAETDFLVMEYVEGENLAERLRRGPLPLEQAIRYGSQIADALAAAHRQNIVHRDLKPGNIMITRTGAKVLDFGLARSATAAVVSQDAPTEHHKPLTAEGTIVGTFQYMAPEQLEGETVDARTDIFALGCVLYEMVTGRRAFEGKTRTSLIAAIVASEPQPVIERQPDAPPMLQHIISRCLRKAPDERWQSATDVAEELRWAGTQREVSAPARRKRSSMLVAGLTLLLIGLALGWLVSRLSVPTESAPMIEASLLAPPGVSIPIPSGEGESMVLAPDGSTVAFVGEEESRKRRVWVRPVGAAAARPLEGTDGAAYPFWSHDSRQIAFFADGKLKRVGLDGSLPVTICDVASNPLSGDWNADDVILFSPSSGLPLHRVSAAGGTSEPITRLDRATGETTHRWARFLPDGETFLYLAGAHELPRNSEVNAIYASRLGSDERTLVLRGRFNFEYANGRLLYMRGRDLFAQPFDPSGMKLTGEPARVAENVDLTPDSFLAAFSTSETGVMVYLPGAGELQSELVWLGPQGDVVEPITRRDNFLWTDLSPDETRALVSIEDDTSGIDVWSLDLARGGLTRLTFGGSGGQAIWSADGRRMYYTGTDREILAKEVGSDAPAEPVIDLEIWGGSMDASPDGRWLSVWTFDPESQTRYDAHLLDLTTGKLLDVATSTAGEFPFGFSPDGRWLLYGSNASGTDELYVVSVPDLQRRHQVTRTSAVSGVWKSNEEIWYRNRPDEGWSSIRLIDEGGALRSAEPRLLLSDKSVVELVPVGERMLGRRLIGNLDPPGDYRIVSHWPDRTTRH